MVAGESSADDLGARGQFVHDFSSLENSVRGNAEAGVRNNFVGGVAFVNGGLEDLHALPCNLRASQPANQFFALAGKHRANHDFDPAHIAFNNIHGFSFGLRFMPP